MAGTCLLAMWCPGYRWRDSSLGSGPELENLLGGDKGKGTNGSPVRPKVPIRRAGTDCPAVAMKRGNARGAKGTGHPRCGRFWSTGNRTNRRSWRKAAAFKGGTSRVTGDGHARFCERLGVKFPGATRRQRVTAVPTATAGRPRPALTRVRTNHGIGGWNRPAAHARCFVAVRHKRVRY